MRDGYEALRGQGANVVAVSPDRREDSARLARNLGLPFPILSDPGLSVAAGYGAARRHDVVPSAFLVDRRGTLRWAFVGRDPTDQPSVAAAVAVLSDRAPLPVPAPSSVLTPAVAVLVGMVFVLLGVLAAVADHDLLQWDEPVRRAIRDVDASWFGSVMRGATKLGSRWVIAALSIPMIVVAWRRCRQLAVVLAGAFPAGLAIELLLKVVVDRPRPALGGGFGSSFPSGHVLAAAAFWGLVPPWIYLVTRRRRAWALSAALAALVVVTVGLSRVYVGAHWPSDVVGGYLGGAVFLLAAEAAVRRPSHALRCDACDLHPLRPVQPGASKTSKA